ncbi:MAG: hypothetical protein ACJAXX_002293 [Roseivirga sp.]|jgi:uncharacterized protein YegP (UPF0339 family)
MEKAFGSWESKASADELINAIRSNSSTNRFIEEL